MTEITLSEALQILQVLSIIFGIAAFFYEYRKSIRERGYYT